MSYNGSGTFNINTAGQPVVTGTVISSSTFNALTADLGTGLSTAITKDGQTVATARIPFAQGINSSLVTDATSTTTGSIITAGGVGIAKALYVGTTLNVAGASTLAAITGTFNGTVGATTPSTGAFTTLSATTTITQGSGASGLILQSHPSVYGAIYSTNVTPSASNYTLVTNGSFLQLNGSSNVNLMVANSSIANASSTGLAVTGTLSATGNVTLGDAVGDVHTTNGLVQIGQGTFAARTGVKGVIAAGNTTGDIHCQLGDSGATWQWINAANSLAVMILSNAGALSATGVVTFSNYGAGAATFNGSGVISSVSDETWKVKDGAPVDPDAMLNKLEPGYWYYNDEKKETFGKDRQLGFYAQNVNAAIGPEAAPEPETVTTKNDDGTETSVTKPWGYYDRSVLAVTVMSLQKALATIESLTARITALEAK